MFNITLEFYNISRFILIFCQCLFPKKYNIQDIHNNYKWQAGHIWQWQSAHQISKSSIYYTGIAVDPEPCSGFLWNLSTQSPQLQDPSGGSFIGGLRQYLKSRVWIFKVGYWFKYFTTWQFNIYNLKKGFCLHVVSSIAIVTK